MQPNLRTAARTYFKIGCLSFGGPAAQIALMHKTFVDEKQWLDEKQYLNALSFCMLLPGPEAMQLATYVGWRLHGVAGGLIAGLAFVLPGALVIYLLALLYAHFGGMDWMIAAFSGIKAVVLIIVLEALLRVSKRALKTPTAWVIAAVSFSAIFLFNTPFPAIIAAAAIYGFIAGPIVDPHIVTLNIRPMTTFWRALFWASLWIVPQILIGWMTGWGFLYQLGLFFSKLAAVTFGGAYSVLAYMSQQVVHNLGWLTTDQMIDALGLAETTPGPLILVTEFVGFLAGHQTGGLGLATAAAVLVLWVTFVPCFLWIFVGAPYIEWITAQPQLKNALSAITAAVVGVILSLSIWFGLHVLFRDLGQITVGPMVIWQPNFATLNWTVLALAGLGYFTMIHRHWNMVAVLAMSAMLGVVCNFAQIG